MASPEALLLDYTQDKVVLITDDGTITYANEATERILNLDVDTYVGENAFEYIHPDDLAEVREAFDRVIEDPSRFRAETVTYRHQTRSGEWVWLESRMSNLTDSALEGYVVSSREVTDRVEAERQKQQSESRLREIANTTDDVLWMFDADWSELLFVNPAYESLFGTPIETLEADPESFLENIHPDDVPAVREAMERLSSGESADIEYRVDPGSEYSKYVFVQGDPVTVDGDVVRIVGFARDVTERRRRERQLAVMDNLLRHNLRNELNVIFGYVEEIEDDPDYDDHERVPVIRQAGEALLETAEKQRRIVDLLTQPVTPRTVALSDVVAAAVATITDRYPQARIETDLPASATVRALNECEFAVIELIENAIKHSPEARPELRIRIHEDAGRIALTVRDDCPPIPDYDRRVLVGDHEMDQVNHSSGCGLWLVHWIVDLSGGSIDVSTEPGVGNEITLRLPKASS